MINLSFLEVLVAVGALAMLFDWLSRRARDEGRRQRRIDDNVWERKEREKLEREAIERGEDALRPLPGRTMVANLVARGDRIVPDVPPPAAAGYSIDPDLRLVIYHFEEEEGMA